MLTLDAHNYTPIFRIRTPDRDPWRRVMGAVQVADGWLFPAYEPFGAKAAYDLGIVAPQLEWSPEARARRGELRAIQRQIVEALQAGHPPAGHCAGFHFITEPYPYQRLGLFLVDQCWRWGLAWEMGLGKTKVMVDLFGLLRERGQFRRALVLTPKVVVPTWRRQVELHAGGRLATCEWVPSDDARVEQALRADVVVATYGAARTEAVRTVEARQEIMVQDGGTEAERRRRAAAVVNPLLALDFDVIVADESHLLGNYMSQQTRAALALSSGRARRYLLSGTLADDARKLYAQLRFLSPALMPVDYEAFERRYVRKHPAKKFLIMGYRNVEELNVTVSRACHSLKKADHLDLPPVQLIDESFVLSIDQAYQYNKMIRELRADMGVKEDGPEPAERKIVPVERLRAFGQQSLLVVTHAATLVNKLLQVTSGFVIHGQDPRICDHCEHLWPCTTAGIKPYTKACLVVQDPPPRQVQRFPANPKLELFEYRLERILEEGAGNKVLVWALFLPELDDIEEVCVRRGWQHVRVDGDSTSKIKQIEQRFQEDAETRVYVGQVGSGVGVSLTAANYTVYYSLPWNRVQYRQSMERNNRPGQTRPMTVYRLLGQDTLDQYVAAALLRKEQIAFTLTDKIACACCDQQRRCAAEQNRPFSKGCIYESAPNRPIARIEEVPE